MNLRFTIEVVEGNWLEYEGQVETMCLGHANDPEIFFRRESLTDHSIFLANLHLCSTHISNLDLSMCAVNKDIVALDITVNNWRVIGVKIDEPF